MEIPTPTLEDSEGVLLLTKLADEPVGDVEVEE